MAEQAMKAAQSHAQKCSEDLKMKIEDIAGEGIYEILYCGKCGHEERVHRSGDSATK